MPRASFTGGTDYSSVFASLYKSQQDQIKSDADQAQAAQDSDMLFQWQNQEITDAQFQAYLSGRITATANDPTQAASHQRYIEYQHEITARQTSDQKAAAQAQQDATDSNTYQQWQQGQIGDQQWLDYLASRVQATANATTPDQIKAHENYVELQRQYQVSIADTQAKNAHDNHTMSDADYIAYLRQSMAGMSPDSQAYRDKQATITSVLDSQLANDTQTQATALTAKIAQGKASLEQLLALYQKAATQARPGTDLANQLATNISKVQQDIVDRNSQGAIDKVQYLFNANQLTGKAAQAQIQQIADTYYKQDPTKYYPLLNSGLQYGKYGTNTFSQGVMASATAVSKSQPGRGILGGGVAGSASAPMTPAQTGVQGNPSSAYNTAHLADLLSSLTGLDYNVAYSWISHENPEGTYWANRNNPLGIKYATDTGSGYNTGVGAPSEVKGDPYANYNSPEDGIRAAAWVLNHYARYAPVLTAAKQGDVAGQVQAIINSGWASSHYGNRSFMDVAVAPRPTGADSAAGGNLGVTYTGGGSKKETKAATDILQANIDRAQNIIDQWNTDPTKPVTDPLTQQTGVLDQKTIHGIELQTLASYDQLIGLYRNTGNAADLKQAEQVGKSKTNFIQTQVVKTNTIPASQQLQQLVSTISGRIQDVAKGNSNDPLAVMQAAADGASQLRAFIAQNSQTQAPLGQQSADIRSTSSATRQTGGVLPATSLPDPKLLQEASAVANALSALSQPGATVNDLQPTLDYIKKTTGTYIPDSILTNAVTAVVNANAAKTGLDNGSLVLASYVATSGPNKGQLVFGPVPVKQSYVPPIAGQPSSVQTVPDVPSGSEPSRAAGESWTQVYMDVNGTPTEVWTKQTPLNNVYKSNPSASPYKVWVASKQVTLQTPNGPVTVPAGQVIPSSWINTATETTGKGKSAQTLDWNSLVGLGIVSQKPAPLDLMTIQTPGYSDGGQQYASQAWIGDPRTGTWTIGNSPLLPQMNSDGTVQVDNNGKVVALTKPNITAGAVPVPYVGNDPKTMQAIWNSGLGQGGGSDMALVVDSTGKVQPASRDYYSTAYYDPTTAPDARSSVGNAQATGSLDSNWWQQDIQDAKVQREHAVQSDAQIQTNFSDRNQNRGQSVNPFLDLSQIAQQVGVNLGSGLHSPRIPGQPSTSLGVGAGSIPPPTNVEKAATLPPPPLVQPQSNTAPSVSLGAGALSTPRSVSPIPIPLPASSTPNVQATAKITLPSAGSSGLTVKNPATPAPANLGGGALATGHPATGNVQATGSIGSNVSSSATLPPPAAAPKITTPPPPKSGPEKQA